MLQKNYILGIDTSCDDTSIAVMNAQTGSVLANVVSSQIAVHAPHGGIVPELASRAHIENLTSVFETALAQAKISTENLASLAVTKTPGLIGCLLVGTSFARGLAYRLGIPLYGINHLHGHVLSPFIGIEKIPYPFLGLVVSGGHTAFYKVSAPTQIEMIGHTVDDAAGEAFDKIAAMLGLGYPGGPVIDKLAATGDATRFKFTPVKVKRGEEFMSFSGLKTAAYLKLQNLDRSDAKIAADFCASVQAAIVKQLCDKLAYFARSQDFKAFALSGGVAMNSLLRTESARVCRDLNLNYFCARPEFCTDNGAMIAHRAYLGGLEDESNSLATLGTKKIPLQRK